MLAIVVYHISRLDASVVCLSFDGAAFALLHFGRTLNCQINGGPNKQGVGKNSEI